MSDVAHRGGTSLNAECSHTRYNGVLHGAVVHHVGKRGQDTHTQLLGQEQSRSN